MPTYDYLCENGHRFELVQRFTEDALDTCVECGAPCKRLLHAPAIHFKGSGFYSTDYGSKKRGPNGAGQETKSESGASKGDGGSSSSDSSSSSGGGETSSKTAASSDSKPASSSSSSSSSSSD
jgi:putative FmdB family regulatory protein